MGDYSNLTNCQSTDNEGEGGLGGGVIKILRNHMGGSGKIYGDKININVYQI